jgi:nitrogenase-associated protein
MATVIFYEKPGCISNARQKKLLKAAGHQVIAKNLLIESWHPDRLRAFFGALAVQKWFNVSAPVIKNGDIKPDRLTEKEALELMLEYPLLIRRPLMQVGDSLMVGFDQQAVDNWIGLEKAGTVSELESCPRSPAQPDCGHE